MRAQILRQHSERFAAYGLVFGDFENDSDRAASGTRIAIARCMNAIGVQLTEDHEQLDGVIWCLAQAAALPHPNELDRGWDEFALRLQRHLEAEERELFPSFNAADGHEARQLLAEHAQIRSATAELSVAVELGVASKSEVLSLLELLWRHATHEETTLYRWASEQAAGSVETVLQVLHESPRHSGVDARRATPRLRQA